MKNTGLHRVGIASVSRWWRISPRRAMIFSGLFTLLAACQMEGQMEGDPEKAPETGYDAKAESACVADGGLYRRAGASMQYLCIMPTQDAGKSCRTENDCSGFCMAETKTCSPVTPMFGCQLILLEDGEQAEICID